MKLITECLFGPDVHVVCSGTTFGFDFFQICFFCKG